MAYNASVHSCFRQSCSVVCLSSISGTYIKLDTTIDSARKLFFQRAWLLYEFDMETNRISIVHSLVLMSYCHDFREEKDCRHWFEVGLSLAQRISLHRDPTEYALSFGCLKMRKRFWWSMCVCDDWVCLRTRGQSLISKAESDVPKLSIHDFDMIPFRPGLASLGLSNGYANYHRDLAENFIQTVGLRMQPQRMVPGPHHSQLTARFFSYLESDMQVCIRSLIGFDSRSLAARVLNRYTQGKQYRDSHSSSCTILSRV